MLQGIAKLMGAYSTIATTRRSLKWLAAITIVWSLVLLLLMGWWGVVVYNQAEKIAELRVQAGDDSPTAMEDWSRTQRMLVAEASAFFLLLAGLTGVMVWLYWRDRRRMNALQAFLASVTHELKTPLTSIRLQAESLSETAPDNPLIERLLEDTGRLEMQVEKTLELARLEGGGSQALEPLPILTWLERFRAGHASGLALTIKSSGEQPVFVLADPHALQVIFRNLVENTLRHSRSDTPSAEITVSAPPGPWVHLAFADTGRGFSGDSRRLGSLFFRGAGSHGAGVGLYLIRTLMHRMGGRADFDANPGQGFTAHLYFRRGEDAA